MRRRKPSFVNVKRFTLYKNPATELSAAGFYFMWHTVQINSIYKKLSAMLRTLFVDFNAYFASVEQQINPALRGRPVGVVPVMAETSCCIAASYEAKAFGIKTGTSVADAKKLCPEITLVVGRHEVYVDFHQRAVAAVERIAPVRQIMSIDEMECELTGTWRGREKAISIAERIKTELINTVGVCMRSSIGIAPNTMLGKLASDMQKPNGLTVLEQADIPAKLLHLKPSAISGVGPRMMQRLEHANIITMADLYAAPRDVLHTVWGGVGGTEMYDKLRGQWYDPREVVTRTLGHSHVLPPELRNAEGAWNVLNRLTQKAAMRLRKQGFYATGMSVFVKGRRIGDMKSGSQRDTTFCETQDTAFFLHVLTKLWTKPAGQGAPTLKTQPMPLAVGLTFFGLVPAAQHTPTLFEVITPKVDRSRLSAAVDKINRLYGKNALYFASAHGALDNAPMRIAFTRIPDIETEM
jgi:DNA polymerase IV